MLNKKISNLGAFLGILFTQPLCLNAVESPWFQYQSVTADLLKESHYSEIDSTQKKAREIANNIVEGKESNFSLSNWYAITAEKQTGGIGQHNRVWVSPPDVNIYSTFYCAIPNTYGLSGNRIKAVTGLSILKTLNSFGFKEILIKWRNDVLLDHKKVSGCLCEDMGTIKNNSNYNLWIFGIGLNVNMKEEYEKGYFLKNLDRPVTSMTIESAKEWNKKEVFNQLFVCLFENIKKLIINKEYSFVNEIEKVLEYKDSKILVEDDDKKDSSGNFLITEGKLIGLDEEINLKVLEEGKAEPTTIKSGRIRIDLMGH